MDMEEKVISANPEPSYLSRELFPDKRRNWAWNQEMLGEL